MIGVDFDVAPEFATLGRSSRQNSHYDWSFWISYVDHDQAFSGTYQGIVVAGFRVGFLIADVSDKGAAAAMYMAALGGTGIRELAKLNHDKAAYLKNALNKAGLETPFGAPFFNEFVVRLSGGSGKTYSRLLSEKIVAGLPLAPYYSELKDHYLLCATETMDREDMDLLVKEVTS